MKGNRPSGPAVPKQLDKPTRYFAFNDNPAEWQDGHFPGQWISGEKNVIYDHFRFVHEADEITKTEFEKRVSQQAGKPCVK